MKSEFEKRFGAAPKASTLANGRVNLIGEHTDYNGGFVLPTSIPQSTRSWMSPRTDRTVRFASLNLPGANREFKLGEEKKRSDWSDYLMGMTKIMAAEGWLTHGFDLLVSSDVPMGSGLSSSAALEVSVMKAIRAAFEIPKEKLTDVQIAKFGQRVENEFVGAHVGIMDQMAAALASEGTALFLDTQSMEFEQIHMPKDKLEIAVLNSGITHSHADGAYNQRRAECEQACRALGIKELREVGVADLDRLAKLPDVVARRARHVITENDRVLKAVECLRGGDAIRMGELLKQGHISMRDDFEISIPAIDQFVEIANHDSDVFGARMTGGGFGGSIVILTRPGTRAAVAERVAKKFQQIGGKPSILVPDVEPTKEMTH